MLVDGREKVDRRLNWKSDDLHVFLPLILLIPILFKFLSFYKFKILVKFDVRIFDSVFKIV